MMKTEMICERLIYFYEFPQIQFVLVMVHAFQLLFKNDCNFPIAFSYFIGAHAVMFYFLFSGFYKSTYNAKNGKSKKVKVESDDGHQKQANGQLNGQKQSYEKIDSGADKFSATRQRVPFAGANGWICQPVHIN